MQDQDYLKRAVELSHLSPEPVGCGAVIVSKGEVIAEAFNSQHIDNVAVFHAEVKALLIANQKTGTRVLEDTVAYCSSEPCGMCITALSYAKIHRVVFCYDKMDLWPDDPQAQLDTYAYTKGLNYVPHLEQMSID